MTHRLLVAILAALLLGACGPGVYSVTVGGWGMNAGVSWTVPAREKNKVGPEVGPEAKAETSNGEKR